jgi:hypothetical protein
VVWGYVSIPGGFLMVGPPSCSFAAGWLFYFRKLNFSHGDQIWLGLNYLSFVACDDMQAELERLPNFTKGEEHENIFSGVARRERNEIYFCNF